MSLNTERDERVAAHIARMFDGHAAERASQRKPTTMAGDGIWRNGPPTCDEADLLELTEMENQLRDAIDYDGDRMLMGEMAAGIVDVLRDALTREAELRSQVSDARKDAERFAFAVAIVSEEEGIPFDEAIGRARAEADELIAARDASTTSPKEQAKT